MEDRKEKLVLIDGHSILNRAFYGVPDLSNAQGLHTNAVYGFLNILFKILEEENPAYLAVAFDVHAPTFRHEIYPEYKGTRKPMPQELREQLPVMKEVLEAMRIVMVERAGLEADDILGTLAKKAEADGMEVTLVSGDRDLLQVATARIKIRIPKTKAGKTEIEDYYAEDVKRSYRVTPLQFVELKALMGDPSDNIPGVPKIGEKTAAALMEEYGSLDQIYARVDEISKKSIRESLQENRALADLSKKLATIRTDAPVTLDYQAACVCGGQTASGSESRPFSCFFTKESYAILKKLEFRNLLDRFSKEQKNEESGIRETFRLERAAGNITALLQRAARQPLVGLWLAIEQGRLLGFALSVPGEATWFCPVASGSEQPVQEALYALSRAEGIRIAAFDVKRQYGYLQREDTARYFDVLIGAYLWNPLKNDYTIETIAAEHLGLAIPGYAELFGKASLGEIWGTDQEDLGPVAEYFCYGAYAAAQAAPVLAEKLREAAMDGLMDEMEMPLSLVLYDMEKEGVEVRPEELKAYGDALTDRIQELEASVHRQAGGEFNLNSPKQLGEILFERMGIPGAKKTRTGYSTAADVLEKLAPEHPIVNDILEYRGLAKLKSTYADGLAAYIGEENRIHTSFNQTITATGRISSTEPNLQNIPMRMELGRRIRKVFVPKEGCVFVDADYSQIELRILAHMSGDEQLIEAYRMDQDIHRITAAKVFHTPLEEVTDLQRRSAKAVNFGIVYGISSFGLSQDLQLSKKEAAAYIDQYFATYPKVKAFLDAQVAGAKEKGYVTTLFGRRRPVPELHSSNFMQRSFGERIAMNSPIQGTAADIMKIAMIKVWKALKEAGLSSRLILQVHDELLIEARQEEAEEVRVLLEKNMRTAADLSVTLEVDLHMGENWYEAK
ncbi:MAG: DNA polymerase I [Clostridium sp.]|jgi:DNA polymerase-1|nr:DNA polymerase I [Clostridium sp.]